MMNQMAVALGGWPRGRPTKLKPIMSKNTSAPINHDAISLVRTPGANIRSGTLSANARAMMGRIVHSTIRYTSPDVARPPSRIDIATRAT